MFRLIMSLMTVLFCGSVMGNEKNQTACYVVEGMTCATCSLTLKVAIKKLDGILKVEASVEKKNAVVRFEPKKTSPEEIEKKIESVGYKPTRQRCLKVEG